MRNGSSHSPPQTLPFSVPPYLLSIEEVARLLNTDPDSGLPDSECHTRHQQYGPNAVLPYPTQRSTENCPLIFFGVVGRRCRGELAQNPGETNRQCDDVGAVACIGCFTRDWLVYRRRRCCRRRYVEYCRWIFAGVLGGKDYGIVTRFIFPVCKRHPSRSCKDYSLPRTCPRRSRRSKFPIPTPHFCD